MTKKAKNESKVDVIDEWPRGGSDVVRVSLTKYVGRDVIDVRTWWLDEDGERKPSTKGITLSVRYLPRLTQALKKARTRAATLGLLQD